MFTATLLTIAKTWKQLKCPTGEWICKVWYIHTMEHHSALKRKDTTQYTTTWMNLKDMMLSETRQSQKDK